jgi:uncharacterized protein YdiU (UPF0061 family)
LSDSLEVKLRQNNVRIGSGSAPQYERFSEINGNHDFKAAVPGGYVDYPVRNIPGGKVAFFNFALAKKMGLIPADHPHSMNPKLQAAILDTFAIQIINEYDRIHGTPIPKDSIRPNKYMATRYLQLQHPDRTGKTSGDGRSIWNGQIHHEGTTWDVTSCGTGATRLSPCSAIENRYFKTGDPYVSYGCGTADPFEGFCTALMSEIFRQNGIETEHCLAIIEFSENRAVNVRAGKNLIRPSHFFHHLKQESHSRLKAAVDYFIQRQIGNGEWPKIPKIDFEQKKYDQLAEQSALTFARMAARFESDYIFVWLDWDGDNILANGGIIDYGSVRQFGLFYGGYRYDDDTRWSTSLPEQRLKARELVQTFIQISDFLKTGKKKARDTFSRHRILQLFDKEFELQVHQELLKKIGFNETQRTYLLTHKRRLIKNFRSIYLYFERALSSAGPYKVGDGITHDPIYNTRTLLRELPRHFLGSEENSLTPEVFAHLAFSRLANRRDKKMGRSRYRKIQNFIHLYREICEAAFSKGCSSRSKNWMELRMRSSVVNFPDRITGESVLNAAEEFMRARKKLQYHEFHAVIEWMIAHQTPNSESTPDLKSEGVQGKLKARLLRIVSKNAEGI